MKPEKQITRMPHTGSASREEYDPAGDPSAPEIGRWYWVGDEPEDEPEADSDEEVEAEDDDYYGDEDVPKEKKQSDEWLGCVTHIGSNYVRLEGPAGRRSSYDTRVHVRNFEKQCRFEPNAEQIIQNKIAGQQREVRALMGDIQEVTARLAISMGPRSLEQGETATLAMRGSGNEIPEYKKALIKAKDKTLPKLFEQIEAANDLMATWMKAPLIPMEAQAKQLRPAIKLIESRIFNVELYAGLIEQLEKIHDGKPAPSDSKLHLFQRRCYMDEECLANYQTGGMTFAGLEDFDKWMVKSENLHRILPFQRCLVAFQVRRHEKDRGDWSQQRFIEFAREGGLENDKLTFLYIRNGEQVFRLNTEIEFGSQLFPDLDHTNLTGKLYAMTSHGDVKDLITEGSYLQQIEEEKAARAAYVIEEAAYQIKKVEYDRLKAIFDQAWKEWRDKTKAAAEASEEYVGYVPSQRWEYEKTEGAITEPEYIHHPSYYPEFRAESWSPYNSSSVFYDDISGYIKKKIDEHNRLVLILQGLFDRSACLHPHPQFQLWTEKGFTDAIQLVYDDSRTLSPTEKPPDWEAYRARCNASLDVGSVTVGQDDAWMRVEAERENKHREQFSHRYSNRDGELRPLTLHRPHGNPGPGMLAKVAGMTRAGACKYEWEREREVNYRIPSYRRKEGPINCHLTVEQSKLFNVSAYQPGDFRQFFNDPRTRSQYLKWACALLEAEEFHAGNRKLGTPGKDDDE